MKSKDLIVCTFLENHICNFRECREKKMSLWDPALAQNFLSRRHFSVSLHYWSAQNVIIFITEKKSEGCKMMRMSCPSFSDNCFRLAVGGRVFNVNLIFCLCKR